MDEGEGWKVADISLADQGARRVDWARSRMPVLARLRDEALQSKPLAGMTVAGCLHVTKETAVLIETIEAAGATVSWSGCNPLSTQNDVAAWLGALPTFRRSTFHTRRSTFFSCYLCFTKGLA